MGTQMKFFALAASALALVSAQEKVNLKEKQLMKEREENMEEILNYIEGRVYMLRHEAEHDFMDASYYIVKRLVIYFLNLIISNRERSNMMRSRDLLRSRRMIKVITRFLIRCLQDCFWISEINDEMITNLKF